MSPSIFGPEPLFKNVPPTFDFCTKSHKDAWFPLLKTQRTTFWCFNEFTPSSLNLVFSMFSMGTKHIFSCSLCFPCFSR